MVVKISSEKASLKHEVNVINIINQTVKSKFNGMKDKFPEIIYTGSVSKNNSSRPQNNYLFVMKKYSQTLE